MLMRVKVPEILFFENIYHHLYSRFSTYENYQVIPSFPEDFADTVLLSLGTDHYN